MFTEYILFDLPEGMTREAVIQGMHEVVPRWLGRPGLIRKTFVYDAASNQAGAFYLWHHREAAQLAHGEAWRQGIRQKYGSEPIVRCFETPLVIDNALGETITPPP